MRGIGFDMPESYKRSHRAATSTLPREEIASKRTAMDKTFCHSLPWLSMRADFRTRDSNMPAWERDRGSGPGCGCLSTPVYGLHACAHFSRTVAGSIRESRALVRYCKVTCFSGRSTLRLPFPHTLPIRDRAVRRSETELREFRLGHFAACSRIGPQQTDIEQA